MKKNGETTVDAYLANVPIQERRLLLNIREIIKKTAPKATESISYQIPTYKYLGPLVFFAHQKNFCSLYTINKEIQKKLEKELKKFEISGTTIHFTPENPLPASVIKKIVKIRMKENEERAKKKIKKT